MAFCAHCGAATQPGMSFCVACGATLPTTPAATAPGALASPAHVPVRPLGKVVRAWVPVILILVTFGVYYLVFWWRASREMDAYAGSRSSPLVASGILLRVVAFVGTSAAAFQLAMPIVEEILRDPTAPIPAAFMEGYVASPLYLGSFALGAVGTLLIALGMFRAWSALAEDEARRGASARIAPGAYAGILAAGVFAQALALAIPALGILSFVGFIAMLWVASSTQSHLNATWNANRAPGVA